jgi:hypothetical protein
MPQPVIEKNQERADLVNEIKFIVGIIQETYRVHNNKK